MVTDRSDHPFAVCLTHDVDRPFKSVFHALYYGVIERRPSHLRSIRTHVNPYWQFESIMALESELGVRSAFYFLSEPSVTQREWTRLLDPVTWVQEIGRYDVRSPAIASLISRLDAGGWEVGLHGSSATATDPERLRVERDRLEGVLDAPVMGGRQHYLDLTIPDTWDHYRSNGLVYDASLGSSTSAGFAHGYDVLRPFDDHFVVFPLTLMEAALPDPGAAFADAWRECESLLDAAAANGAVMTVLWHPRFFSKTDFPGYRRLYRRLVRTALDRGAWVGPPAAYYNSYLVDVHPDRRPLPDRHRVGL